MSFSNILYQSDGPVVTLTINREKALNALNPAVLAELRQAVAQVAADPASRVVIITGAGERAFVAGADIAAMADLSAQDALRFAEQGHELCDALAHLPQPVLAAVNGFALGGGTELALACDVIYASTRARFGQPEVNIGVMPGFGGTQRLPRLVGPGRAAHLIFTGEPIDAAEAHRIGLVAAVLPPEELLPHCRKVAQTIASRAPLAVAAAKRALHAAQEQSLSEGLLRERELFAGLFATTDQKEGMRAFLDKRQARFTGA